MIGRSVKKLRLRSTAALDEGEVKSRVILKWQSLMEKLGQDSLEDFEVLLGEQKILSAWEAIFADSRPATMVKRYHDINSWSNGFSSWVILGLHRWDFC